MIKAFKEYKLAAIAFATFCADLLALVYIYFFYLGENLISTLKLSLSLRGYPSDSLSLEQLEQMAFLLTNSLSTMLVAFLVWHTIVYFLVSKSKVWAINYTYRYVLGTLVLSIIEFFVLLSSLKLSVLYLIPIGAIYLYSFIGLRKVRSK